MFNPIQQDDAKKTKRYVCVSHVEDLKKVRQSTPGTIWDWSATKDVHRFVVDEIFDRSLIQRKLML